MKTLKEIKRRGTGSLYLGPVKNANTKSVTYNSFGKVVKEGMNDKTVPVYHKPDKRGDYQLVGHVHHSATSIGAAKLAGKKSARFEKVAGMYGWIAEGLLDKHTSSPEELAKKHGVSLEHINTQLEKGIKVEQEHTSNLDAAREIALDHLGEDPNYYSKLKKMEESVQKNDQVTIHYGAHAKESHRVTMLHGDGEVTIQPAKRRGRENRYPGGELKVPQTDLHKMNELHDEPDRIGAGMRGTSGTEGLNMTEEPRKTLKVTKAEWAHHTQHATAQYDTDGKPWIVKKDPSGAAIRIPVSITEDYPHRQTLRKVLKEALPFAPEPKEKEVSKTTKTVKGVVKKDKKDTKDTKDSGEKLTIGKEKDKFEPDPVLTPVLSIANMPGGSVR